MVNPEQRFKRTSNLERMPADEPTKKPKNRNKLLLLGKGSLASPRLLRRNSGGPPSAPADDDRTVASTITAFSSGTDTLSLSSPPSSSRVQQHRRRGSGLAKFFQNLESERVSTTRCCSSSVATRSSISSVSITSSASSPLEEARRKKRLLEEANRRRKEAPVPRPRGVKCGYDVDRPNPKFVRSGSSRRGLSRGAAEGGSPLSGTKKSMDERSTWSRIGGLLELGGLQEEIRGTKKSFDEEYEDVRNLATSLHSESSDSESSDEDDEDGNESDDDALSALTEAVVEDEDEALDRIARRSSQRFKPEAQEEVLEVEMAMAALDAFRNGRPKTRLNQTAGMRSAPTISSRQGTGGGARQEKLEDSFDSLPALQNLEETFHPVSRKDVEDQRDSPKELFQMFSWS